MSRTSDKVFQGSVIVLALLLGACRFTFSTFGPPQNNDGSSGNVSLSETDGLLMGDWKTFAADDSAIGSISVYGRGTFLDRTTLEVFTLDNLYHNGTINQTMTAFAPYGTTYTDITPASSYRRYNTAATLDAENDFVGIAQDGPHFSLNYQTGLYAQVIPVSDLAGNYLGDLRNSGHLHFTLGSNGTLSGFIDYDNSTTQCNVSGSVSVDNTSRNLFNASVTIGGVGCTPMQLSGPVFRYGDSSSVYLVVTLSNAQYGLGTLAQHL